MPETGSVVGYAPTTEIVRAELAEPITAQMVPERRRRVVLPLVLFLLTCASTFFAGATGWMPLEPISEGLTWTSLGTQADPYFMLPVRLDILEHWREGLIYMACVLAILLTHEM